jgi:hypothetical protein
MQKLSRDHIKYVLGIDVSLNESVSFTEEQYILIIESQLAFDQFFNTVKDSAKKAYNQVVTKINSWVDAAVILKKVLPNSELLQNFSSHLWRKFTHPKTGEIKVLYDILDKLNLSDLKKSIERLVDKIWSLKGWTQFMAATTVVTLAKYAIKNIKNFPGEKLKQFIISYLSDNALKDIFSKLTDFKSYIGWLKPIIGTADALYDALGSTISKFSSAFTLQNKIQNQNEDMESLYEGEFCPQCLAQYIREHINSLQEAEYQGRKVPLGKPMRGDVKKFKVYVKNNKGNIVKVNFGDPNMKIKKSNPKRRKSFRARHHCDTNPGPRWKARYWSCRKW